MRVPVVLAVVGLLLVGGGTGAVAAESGAATTWALEPSTAEGPDDRVSLRHAIDPGAQTTDHVTLTNFSPHAAVFDVYPGDGILTADGQFDLPPADSTPADAGSWITVGDAAPGAALQVEVGPESSVTLPVTVQVPVQATPGDHPAGIVAALSGSAAGVSMESRVGVRLHLRVTGDLAPALTVQDVRTSYTPSWNPFSPGTLRVEYEVVNSGNVRLGATSDVEAAGVFGIGTSTADGPALREVLPGASAGGTAEVPAWPLLRATGTVTVDPTVVGEDQVDSTLSSGSAAVTAWMIPWPQLVLLFALVALVLAVRQLRQRREAAVRRRIAAAVAAAR